MYKFSNRSRFYLTTCNDQLITLFNEVIKDVDCTILYGLRGEAEQEEAYRLGRSTKNWPDSRHNKDPSSAVDVVPYPIDWIDFNRMAWFAGWVLRTAHYMQLPLRWGGDWDSDTHISEHTLIDMPHFELKEVK